MSRVGRKLITVPEGVTVEVKDGNVYVNGPKAALSFPLSNPIEVTRKNGTLEVINEGKTKLARSLHGTVQRSISNAIHGVTEGWKKDLEIVGTGYRARVDGGRLVLTVGYSHPVNYDPPEGVSFTVKDNVISVAGTDKHLVGQIAANIKRVRKPDPYKGKGVRYLGEKLRRKAGKAAKAAA